MRAPVRRHLFLVVVALLACSEGGTLPSPTVRVDLSEHLPERARKRFVAADTSYECDRKLTVAAQGGSQRFVLTWRVFEADAGQRYITAVQVDPDGAFSGGRGPKASAAVSPAGGKERKVTVQIGWEARKGCGEIRASQTLTLSPDDPSCKPPKPAGKIFSK